MKKLIIALFVFLFSSASAQSLTRAAYPGADCSSRNIPTLTIAAEFDGLISLQTIRDSQAQLPKNSQLEVINGGVHAFFGRYGIQARDGTPTVPREVFEVRLLEVLSKFMAQF
jgi:dienelactone hydrolase